jgi:hypothetical protein
LVSGVNKMGRIKRRPAAEGRHLHFFEPPAAISNRQCIPPQQKHTEMNIRRLRQATSIAAGALTFMAANVSASTVTFNTNAAVPNHH